MRKLLLSILLVGSFVGYSQTAKIKVVFVANIDSTFTVVSFDSNRQFSINFKNDWDNDLKQYLDKNKYELSFDTLPESMRKFTRNIIRLPKNNPKVKNWMSYLHNKGYDIVLILYKSSLIDYENSGILSDGFGLMLANNQAYALNGINAYRVSDFKRLANMGLFSTDDFIKDLDKKAKIRKSIDEITISDLAAAIQGVKELNRKIAIENVCKKMNSDEFQSLFYKKNLP
jgi:hypothetical protein